MFPNTVTLAAATTHSHGNSALLPPITLQSKWASNNVYQRRAMATGISFDPTSRAEEVIAVLLDTTVPLENVAELIISLPRDFEGVDAGDEPNEGVEDFLWFLWEGFLDIAEEAAEIHPRLREFLKLFTVLNEPSYLLWGSELTLAQLPLLGAVSRERINGMNPPKLPLSIYSYKLHFSWQESKYLVIKTRIPSQVKGYFREMRQNRQTSMD